MMRFNITGVALPGSKICLGYGKEITFDDKDRTVLIGEHWFKYKKSDTSFDELRVKGSDKAVLEKTTAFSYKDAESLRYDTFLGFGVPPFLEAIVKKNIGKGLVSFSIGGVGETVVILDWSEHLVDFDSGSIDAFDRLYDVFFDKDGQWIYGLEKVQEKAWEYLIERVKDQNTEIEGLDKQVAELSEDKAFYKVIVTDLVNTVIPTTPESIWDMDRTENGRSSQTQAVGVATTAIAELLRKRKPINEHLSPRAYMLGIKDSSEYHLATASDVISTVEKTRPLNLVQMMANIKHLDQVPEEPKNLEMTFVEKFYPTKVVEIWAPGGDKSYLLSKTIAKMAK